MLAHEVPVARTLPRKMTKHSSNKLGDETLISALHNDGNIHYKAKILTYLEGFRQRRKIKKRK